MVTFLPDFANLSLEDALKASMENEDP